jgi:hypothetical protein
MGSGYIAQIYSSRRAGSELKSDSDGTSSGTRTRLSLRSVGTEFNVMQELLRHSSLRSTLDAYPQAISPAKHAAQAAVQLHGSSVNAAK